MIPVFRNTLAVLDNNEKKEFRLLIILDTITSIIDIFSLALLLWIIQFYIQPVSKTKLSFLPDWLTNRNSVAFISVFFILFGLKNFAAYLIARSHYKFFGRVAMRISTNNLIKYQRSGYPEFVNIDSSDHIRRIALQPFEFCQYMLSGIQQIVTQSSLIILTVIAIVLFNAKLFLLLLLILLPPAIVIFYFIKKRLTKAKKYIQTSNQRSYQYLLDALKGYIESNIYNRNDFFLRRFIRSREKFSVALFESISIQNMPTRIIEVFAMLGLFLLIAIAQWSGNNDSATFITIGAFIGAAYKIIPGLVKIINASGQMRAYEFSVADLAGNDDLARTSSSTAAASGISSIQFNNISFQYTNESLISNFSLSIKKGDFIGLCGISGKGKTTVLNLLLGFLDLANGQILINDHQLNAESLRHYWPLISYVRQQSFFIHDTILRNITLEEDGYNNEALQCALKNSGLNKFVAAFPEGLEKIITENGKNISGGQQQRVAITRAMYKKADLILLDEPFNELDEPSVQSMLEYFKELSLSGKMIILITHDKKSLSYCNKVVSLDAQG